MFFFIAALLGIGSVGAIAMGGGGSSDDDAPVAPGPSASPSQNTTTPIAASTDELDEPSATDHNTPGVVVAEDSEPDGTPATDNNSPVAVAENEPGTPNERPAAGDNTPIVVVADDEPEASEEPTPPVEVSEPDGTPATDDNSPVAGGTPGNGTGGEQDDGSNTDTGSDSADAGGQSGPCPVTGDDVCHCNDDDDDSHAGHSVSIELPTSSEEIEDFVATIRAAPETHSHDEGSSLANEHTAAMDLVPRGEATHIAIGHGDWDDPSNWHNGEVPGDGAKVLIPEGVNIKYDHVSTEELFTLRVDGHLEFATDTDSQLIVDTFVVSPSGELTIGTEDNPVDPDVNVDIIFANNGPIDTDWDPMLLSRGLISHGKTTIHGAEKDSHEKVIEDPLAGDTSIDFGETPEGWAVGDTIVIAGTRYEGYKWDNSIGRVRHYESEDEERVITHIEDGVIFFDEPLEHDHDSPREDLKTSVANYTRNVSFETEDAETAEIFERGHVMFMHTDDVDVRFAEFHELGRTDKSETALNVSEFDTIESDTNVKGRYSFHLHRAGVEDTENPAIAVGNAVYGSPGWGFVHHDSHAIFDNNATFDTFGAGYVAESGNETGSWTNNIAIFAQGNGWTSSKNGNDTANFDLGQTGDGFWFQGRLVESTDNVAASVNHGFVYFHRGRSGEDGIIGSDSEAFDFPSALNYGETVRAGSIPITSFSGNETFASRVGLEVIKANPRQDHDIHSNLENFTAWGVQYGAYLEYTAHYTLENFDLIGKTPTAFSDVQSGISFGTNTFDVTVVNATVSGFQTGIDLEKSEAGIDAPDEHNFTVVDAVLSDNRQDYENYDLTLDRLLSSSDLSPGQHDIELDGPLRLVDSSDPLERGVFINGTKTDSLGETAFPASWESFWIQPHEAVRLLETDGYYTTSDGQDYFVLDLFSSDRATGDVYLEKHAVFVGPESNLGVSYSGFRDAVYNGVRDLDGSEDDPTFDTAVLWATLTDGQVNLTDEALAIEQAEEEWHEENALPI